jgi:3-oxoacyl-[acyl-carrier protein] reductase
VTRYSAAGGCALVTGASRGLGAAIALGLGKAGWRVAVNYAHDEDGAARVVEEVRALGVDCIAARFDVTNANAVRAGVATLVAELGPVSAVVNNATGPQPEVPLAEQTWKEYIDQLEFFVKAPLLILREVLPSMRSHGNGRIVNIGSEVTTTATLALGHYTTAKAAMIGLTRAWAKELAADGITVNIVEPGWIPIAERFEHADSEEFKAYAAGVPMGRVGDPNDVAAAVVYLVSSGANFVTGQRFAVNGGNTYS